jgi:hypothetical protein
VARLPDVPKEVVSAGEFPLLGTAEHSVTLVPQRRWDIWKISLRLGLEAAVFADAGIAWTESRELARAGLGGGLRLLFPGSEMVRLDLEAQRACLR